MRIRSTSFIVAAMALVSSAAGAPSQARPGTSPASSPATNRAGIPVSVDPRVELMSIIFHLAGNPEYRRPRVESYAKDVAGHFGPFADHAVVKLARELRNTRSVSYDAPMSLAIHFSDAATLKEAVPFDPRPADIDSRWRPDDIRLFVQHARDFTQQAHFDEFLRKHQRLYDLAASRMAKTMADHAHLEWFDAFFGRRGDVRFHLVLGMLNGGNCYGGRLATAGATEMYCILGVWSCDEAGLPQFPALVLPTVIHEFSHSYVNPLVDKHAADFEPAAQRIFPRVEQVMRRQAYGNWRTMILESVVRACVVRYRLANDGSMAALAEIARNSAAGFSWTAELCKLLGEYEQQREKYPALESFMPRIVAFFDDYASKLPQNP